MRLQHGKITKLILVAAGLIALPGLALGATPDGADEEPLQGSTPPATATMLDSADSWLSGLMTGWVPGWLEEWLGDSPAGTDSRHERDVELGGSPGTDSGDEPRIGGVDDPAGPWA
jgi:hypothetical protein